MRYLKLFSFLCLSFVSSSYGHTFHLGRTCPRVTPFANLSIKKILGPWFVAYKLDTWNTCIVWDISESQTNSEQLEIQEVMQIHLLDRLGYDHTQVVTATLDTPNPEIPAKMRVSWPTSISGKADFVIFDTDYDNYVAIIQCDRWGLLHRRDVTILSKERNIDESFVKRVRRLLDSIEVPHHELDQVPHTKCNDESSPNWHIKGELFGLIHPAEVEEVSRVSSRVDNYDISELEIIGEGVSKTTENEML